MPRKYVLLDDLTGEEGELPDEVFEHLTDGGPVGLHRRLAGGVLAEDGGQAHFDRHSGRPPADKDGTERNLT